MKLMTVSKVRKILNSLSADIVSLCEKKELKKFCAGFQRNRKLPLPKLIKFLLLLDKGNIPHNLRSLFPDPDNLPSPAALCNRRKLLSPDLLMYLFLMQNETLDKLDPHHDEYRILACDGSDFTALGNSDDMDSYVCTKSGANYNIYHLDALFNLSSFRYERAIIRPKRFDNERASFLEMVKVYENSSNTIFMMDRGYECWDIILYLLHTTNYFVIRLKSPKSSGILASIGLPTENEYDVNRTVYLTHRHCPAKKSLLHPDGMLYRQVKPQHASLSVQIRIVRIPKSDGDSEYLVTNLPFSKFSTADLGKLYHRRWDIETGFRNLKQVLGAMSFHSKEKQKIFQEIWAKLIIFNVVSTLQHVIKPAVSSKLYQYRSSFCRVWETFRDYCLEKVTVKQFIQDCVKTPSPERPGRSAPRKVRTQGAIPFLYR